MFLPAEIEREMRRAIEKVFGRPLTDTEFRDAAACFARLHQIGLRR